MRKFICAEYFFVERINSRLVFSYELNCFKINSKFDDKWFVLLCDDNAASCHLCLTVKTCLLYDLTA